MRKSIWGLALALIAALVVAGSAAAQPPGRKGGPPGKGPRGPGGPHRGINCEPIRPRPGAGGRAGG